MKNTIVISLILFSVLHLQIFVVSAQIKTDSPTVAASLAKQYQTLAQIEKPVYISTDLAFEQVSFFFSDALEAIEKEVLAKKIETGLSDAFDKTAAALQSEKDGAVREILTSNLAYLLTAMRLLLPEGSEKIKAADKRAVELLISADLRQIADELKLVLAAKELAESPVLGYTEDYTQYTPRGRYTASEEQTRYFRAIVWLGRMGFYTEPNAGNGIDEKKADYLTARAAMLLKVAGASNAFTDFDKTMTALVGASDDLTIGESIALVEKATGKKSADLSFQEIVTNAPKIRALVKTEARKPRILSTVAEEGKPAPVAMRLIGQRFTPDSYVFQNLTFSAVKDYTGKAEPFTLSVTMDNRKVRGVPRVFDVLDALGMRFADLEIKKAGDDLYESYATQSAQMRKEIPLLLKVKNFTTAYLSAIKANDYITDTRTPEHSTNRRHLNSAVGAYTLLRHELAAYAKQSYTNVGRGIKPEAKPRTVTPKTFVENAPLVFDSLKQAVEALNAMPENKSLAGRGAKLIEFLAALAKESKTDKQAELPASVAETLWKQIDEFALIEKQSAVVADVHTDLNSKQVLQIGVGQPQVVELTVGNQKASAAIFTTYEFRQSLEQRLTDQQWRKMLGEASDKTKFRMFVISEK